VCVEDGFQWGPSVVSFDPAGFLRDVRSEVSKVTWPSRRETLVTTAMVIGMAVIASFFFFAADQLIGLGVRTLFSSGA
jgi:preprotein translocase subunit SecE